MLSQFAGEFLLHPCPIEYSGNTCSHNCGYCFANIRCETRRANLTQTLNIITGKSKSNGILNYLFRNGHPICISNRTDPFSASNIGNTIPVLKILAQQPNGIFFQTKGGIGIESALDVLHSRRDVVFYITVTTLRNEVSTRMEPHAPLPSERIALAKQLKKAGFEVIIAINPCLELWMPEDELVSLENEMASIGITRFAFQRLMLNTKIINSFTAARRAQFADDEIALALSKENIYHRRQLKRHLARGLDSCAIGMPYKTKFFDSINNLIPRSLNNLYTLANKLNRPQIVCFEDYVNAMIERNEHLLAYTGKDLSHYILCQNRSAWKNPKHQRVKTFRELLGAFWNCKQLGASPQRNFMFRVVMEGGSEALDDDGNIMLWYDGETHRETRTVEASNMKGGD